VTEEEIIGVHLSAQELTRRCGGDVRSTGATAATMASTTVRMVAAGGPADSCRRGGWRGGRAGAAAAAAGRGTQAALPASVRLSKGSAAGRRGIRCAELQLCRRAVVARASEPQQTVMLDTVEEQLSSPTTTEDETLPYRQWVRTPCPRLPRQRPTSRHFTAICGRNSGNRWAYD
jgi:hypothetical protein